MTRLSGIVLLFLVSFVYASVQVPFKSTTQIAEDTGLNPSVKLEDATALPMEPSLVGAHIRAFDARKVKQLRKKHKALFPRFVKHLYGMETLGSLSEQELQKELEAYFKDEINFTEPVISFESQGRNNHGLAKTRYRDKDGIIQDAIIKMVPSSWESVTEVKALQKRNLLLASGITLPGTWTLVMREIHGLTLAELVANAKSEEEIENLLKYVKPFLRDLVVDDLSKDGMVFFDLSPGNIIPTFIQSEVAGVSLVDFGYPLLECNKAVTSEEERWFNSRLEDMWNHILIRKRKLAIHSEL